jgi:ketosteroid isomerase-like protein
MSSRSTRVFEQFVAAINGHNLSNLALLMTHDHAFIDSMGNRMQGDKLMRDAWRNYFAMCPDYWIQIRSFLSDGDIVLATGLAGGTIDRAPWQTPTAWEAVIHNGLVQEWRVFADNKPVYEILSLRRRR